VFLEPHQDLEHLLSGLVGVRLPEPSELLRHVQRVLRMTILVSIETVLLVLIGLLVAGMLRSHADILRALKLGPVDEDEELDASPPPPPPANVDERLLEPAVDIRGVNLELHPLTLAVKGGRGTLLGFLSTGCLTCVRFWEAFSDPQDGLELPDGTRLILVTKDAAEERVAKLRELAPSTYPVIMSSQAWTDYDVPGAPYFVWIDGPTATVRGVGAADKVEGVLNLLRDQFAEEGLPDASADRDERQLLAAGITPGHPSLYGAGWSDDVKESER